MFCRPAIFRTEDEEGDTGICLGFCLLSSHQREFLELFIHGIELNARNYVLLMSLIEL
jgi:hypothetical protein